MTIPEVFIAAWGLTGLIGLIGFLAGLGKQMAADRIGSREERVINQDGPDNSLAPAGLSDSHFPDDPVALIAHGLKTPLTSIRSFSEILRNNPDLSSEQRGQFLDIVIKETQRLNQTIDTILQVSRFESGQWRVDAAELMTR